MRIAILVALAAALLPGAEKELILHADDLGFTHAANLASFEMLEKGHVSSASVMMPCPWAAEVAAWARKNTDKDLGVHITLTSEWKTLRWGPLAPRDKVPGLLDPDGYLWAGVKDVATRATPREVEIEVRAQIELAKKLGIRFTHLDTHMGTLYARPDYFEVFAKLGQEYGVPILRVKPSEDLRRDAPASVIEYLLNNEERFRKEGWFRLDSLLPDPTLGTPDPAQRKARYHQALRNLKPGVHMLILHPAALGDETRAATGTAVQRDLDYRIFSDPETVKLIRDLGIQLVGWKDVAGAGK
ncbi:MAG: polysaccharide deacetylase family protein [Acidobacteriota bacterium]